MVRISWKRSPLKMGNTNTPQEFMAAYDINDSDGSATLNLMKAALLPSWRETFKKLEASSQVENKKRLKQTDPDKY